MPLRECCAIAVCVPIDDDLCNSLEHKTRASSASSRKAFCVLSHGYLSALSSNGTVPMRMKWHSDHGMVAVLFVVPTCSFPFEREPNSAKTRLTFSENRSQHVALYNGRPSQQNRDGTHEEDIATAGKALGVVS